MKRTEMVNRVGVEYLTSNVENEEYSYPKAFKEKSLPFTAITNSTGKRRYEKLDLRFECDGMTVLIETKSDYTRQEEEIKAKREKRRPLLLPHFTNHQLRHTFCSRLCEQDVNVKLIQEVMGHADVSTTFDIYAEFSAKKKKEAFKLLDNGSIIKTQKKVKQEDDN